MTQISADIYFDESGFTGNNLLHPKQTIFSYGSVQVEEEEAKDFVSSVIKRCNIQNGELKGANLLKYNKGKKVIDEILTHFNGRMKVSLHEKKYALAAKFYEYIFEPTLQKNNFLFYQINFHKFISNILYMEFTSRGAGAEELFQNFERLMRTGSFDELKLFFETSTSPGISSILSEIREFAVLNQSAIAEELDGYAGEGAGKWVLDLTNTSLFSLLAEWGQEFDQVTAICDQSNPLSHDQEMFNVMIGRTDKKYSPLGEEKCPITFNLRGPIKLVDSRSHPGVQLADCVAAAFAYTCNRSATDEYAQKWRNFIGSTIVYGSVFADLDYVDLEKPSVQRNTLVLIELLERSRKGAGLLFGMSEYVNTVTEALTFDPIQMG